MENLFTEHKEDDLELPTTKLQEDAKEFLNEYPETRMSKLFEMKNAIEALDPTEQITDRSFSNLIRFLRANKFDIDNAVKATVKLNKFIVENPAWTNNHSAAEFRAFEKIFQCLEQRDDQGRLIVAVSAGRLAKLYGANYLREHQCAHIRFVIWLVDKFSRNPYAQVYGIVIMVSFKDSNSWDAMRMSRAISLDERLGALLYIQNHAQLRLEKFLLFFFYEPFYLKWTWNAMHSFFSRKLVKRIFLCGENHKILEKVISNRKILPLQFGGVVDVFGK
jgi:hypothetical protein